MSFTKQIIQLLNNLDKKHEIYQIAEDILKTPSSQQLFYEQLFDYHTKQIGCFSSSKIDKSYDFYSDCIFRHIGKNFIAFTEYSATKIESWTYEQLHKFVCTELKKWKKKEIHNSNLVILLVPFGLSFIIAMLCCISLGIAFFFLPINSPFLSLEQIEIQVKKINPDYIISEKILSDFQSNEINIHIIKPEITIDDNNDFFSISYQPKKCLYKCLAMYRQEFMPLVSLSAKEVYHQILSDGLLLFNLKEKYTWLTPLDNTLVEQPYKILSSLFHGANFKYFSEHLLMDNPNLLEKEKVHILGVSSRLRELLIEKPCNLSGVGFWYTNPLNQNYQSWVNFTEKNKLKKVVKANILIDSSFGGVNFFTQKSLEIIDPYIFPKIASQNLKTPLSLKESESFDQPFIYHPISHFEDNQNPKSNLFLYSTPSQFFFAGCEKPTKKGCVLPIEEIENYLNLHPLIERSCLLLIPKSEEIFSHQIILLAFVKQNVQLDQISMLKIQIIDKITYTFGSFYIPDLIETYQLYPRYKNNVIDRNWCRYQYLSKLLDKKNPIQAYQDIHKLKSLIQKAKLCQNV